MSFVYLLSDPVVRETVMLSLGDVADCSVDRGKLKTWSCFKGYSAIDMLLLQLFFLLFFTEIQ